MDVISLDAEIPQLSVINFTSLSLYFGGTSTRRFHGNPPYKGNDAAEMRFYDLKYLFILLRMDSTSVNDMNFYTSLLTS